MGAGVIDIMLLLGALHGLALAAALLLRTQGRRANRWLGLLILLFAVDMGSLWLLRTQGPERLPHLVGLSDPFVYLYSPLVYLYVRTLVRGRSPGRRDLGHALPALAALAAALPLLTSDAAHKAAHWSRICEHGPATGTTAASVLTLGLSLLYLLASHRLVRTHRAAVRERFSDLEHRDLNWLRLLLLAVLAMWSVSVVLLLAGAMHGQHGGVIFSLVTVFLYGVGFMALRQPELFAEPAPRAAPATPPAEPEPRYSKARLDDDRADSIRRRLEEHLDRARPYRRPGLTLQELADELDVSAHVLSQVINVQMGRNFYDLINERRVAEACRRLDDPAHSHLTVLAVAMDAGFRSKSTFNAIFKKTLGLTPTQYRERPRPTASGS